MFGDDTIIKEIILMTIVIIGLTKISSAQTINCDLNNDCQTKKISYFGVDETQTTSNGTIIPKTYLLDNGRFRVYASEENITITKNNQYVVLKIPLTIKSIGQNQIIYEYANNNVNATITLTIDNEGIHKLITVYELNRNINFQYNEQILKSDTLDLFKIHDFYAYDMTGKNIPITETKNNNQTIISIRKQDLTDITLPLYIDPSITTNYSDTTNNKAYYSTTSPASVVCTGTPPTLANGLSTTTEMPSYTNLTNQDYIYAYTNSSAGNADPSQRFIFKINTTETGAVGVNNITVTYTGKKTASETQCCFIANWTSQTFIPTTITDVASTNTNYTASYTGLAARQLINTTDGRVAFVCYGDGFDTDDSLDTDYVALTYEYSSLTDQEYLLRTINAYYTFNNTFNDSVNGYHLSNSASTVFANYGIIDKSAQFERADSDYLYGNTSNICAKTSTPFTINFWANMSNIKPGSGIFKCYDGTITNGYYRMYVESNFTIAIDMYDGGVEPIMYTKTYLPQNGSFNMYTFTINPQYKSISMYMNARLNQTFNYSVAWSGIRSTGATTFGLGTQTSTPYYFDGEIDEFAIFFDSLNQTVINYLYQNGSGLNYNFSTTTTTNTSTPIVMTPIYNLSGANLYINQLSSIEDALLGVNRYGLLYRTSNLTINYNVTFNASICLAGNCYNNLSVFNDTSYINSLIEGIHYNITNTSTVLGTNEGNYLSLRDYDGVTFNVTEASSDLDLRLNFSNVTSFNQVHIRYSTATGENHDLNLYIWDYDSSTWESYTILSHTDANYIILSTGVFDYSDHIQNGVVQIRLYELGAGLNHKWSFDWITISSGLTIPSTTEVDPLSIHKDGTTPLTSNWNVGNYNITAQAYYVGNSLIKVSKRPTNASFYTLFDLDHTSGMGNSTISSSTGIIRGYSFIADTDYCIDQISVLVTLDQANTVCAVALYNNTEAYYTSNGKPYYPHTLIMNYSGINFSTSGFKTVSISPVKINANQVYHQFYWCLAGGTGNWRMFGSAMMPTMYGLVETWGSGAWAYTNLGWQVTAAYNGTFPTTFPATGSLHNWGNVAVGYRARTDTNC